MAMRALKDERKRVYEWALAREQPRYPGRITLVVADQTDYDGRARYTVVCTATTTVSLDEIEHAQQE